MLSRPRHARPRRPHSRRPHSRRPPLASLALIALGAAALPLAAGAQTVPADSPVSPWERRSGVTLAVGGGGLYSSLDQVATAHDGFGFDAAAYLGIYPIALGVGYQRTLHDGGGARASTTYEGVFVEPRLGLGLEFRGFTPYLTGRVVRLRPITGGGDDAPRGVQVSGGAGLLVALAPRVGLDLGATYGRLRFDAASTPSSVDRTTNVAQLRVGLLVGFAHWRGY